MLCKQPLFPLCTGFYSAIHVFEVSDGDVLISSSVRFQPVIILYTSEKVSPVVYITVYSERVGVGEFLWKAPLRAQRSLCCDLYILCDVAISVWSLKLQPTCLNMSTKTMYLDSKGGSNFC